MVRMDALAPMGTFEADDAREVLCPAPVRATRAPYAPRFDDYTRNCDDDAA